MKRIVCIWIINVILYKDRQTLKNNFNEETETHLSAYWILKKVFWV